MCKKLCSCFLKGKQFLILLLPLLFCNLILFAQQKVTVSGAVISERNIPLAGVSVKVKGSTGATTTDSAGIFSIKANKNSVLVFSYVGFNENEVKIINESLNFKVQLTSSSETLGDVVVTALGIQRKSKGITYAAQKVPGSELNKVPQTNFMNALSGRVAGITINSSASGIGGSVKVILRGNKSAQGSNQPLYVIDGVPLRNNANESPNSFANMDFGDGISNLNPEDIESVTVLKGASSAALYGSQAANGVILITTKKGKAGVSKLNVFSSGTFDKAAYIPELQNTYAQTAIGSDFSWGAPITSGLKNQISDYFETGSTFINGISLSTATEKVQTYFSYANTKATGIIPNNSLSKHNISFNTTSNYFNNKLSIDINANLVLQSFENPPTSGYNGTALWGLYLFPRGLDFSRYKNYEVYDPVRKLMTQNWWRQPDNLIHNPYWNNNRMENVNELNRAIVKISAKYNITPWLNIQARGNVDRTGNVTTSKMYSGSSEVVAGKNGYFGITNVNNTQYYGDVLMNFNKTFDKIKLSGLVGSSILDASGQGEFHNSSSLYIANIFNLQNTDPLSANTSYGSISPRHSQLQAVFGNLNVSYNDWLFLDVTARNDWSSNLSFTPNGSYYYPSFGISTVLNSILNLPKFISYAKLRGSYATVGNTVPSYVTNPINTLSRGGNISFNTTAPFNDLNPEKSKSLEIGAEMRMLENKLNLDFTYYKTNTINQFFSIGVPPGTGYSQRFINGGNIQNSGIELTLGYAIMEKKRFKWNSSINFSTNKNVIKELAPGIDQFFLNPGDLNNYFSILKVGGSYGDIYSVVWDRDLLNRLKIDSASSKPIVKSGAPSLVGNANPKFQIGWSNTFTYKNFTLDFLVDGRFGSKVISTTQAALNNYGVSKTTGDARANGGVPINGVFAGTNKPVNQISAYNYYLGRPYGEYMFDGSVVRLRELSIGYNFPIHNLKSGFVKNIRLSLIGRNLIYFYRPAPTDSEITYSVGNAYAGLDAFSLPPTRSLGFNLSVNF